MMMIKDIKYIEPNTKLRIIELVANFVFLITGIAFLLSNNITLINIGLILILLAISVATITLYGKLFSLYEKTWFISIMILASIFAIVFPEENVSGIKGVLVMFLYLLDTFLNILCELLISKQSKYNFIVSLFVEITEIIICLILQYRFATLSVTLLFWIPVDIISYINWNRHKDDKDLSLTVVRRLKGYQEVLIIIGIIVWTIVVGYLVSGLNISSSLLMDEKLETIIIYLDACVSAVGIANGLFILFRLEEQWLAWYIYSFLDAAINILSKQYILLILKLAYLTNTTYGYIKWNKYIKEHDNLNI